MPMPQLAHTLVNGCVSSQNSIVAVPVTIVTTQVLADLRALRPTLNGGVLLQAGGHMFVVAEYMSIAQGGVPVTPRHLFNHLMPRASAHNWAKVAICCLLSALSAKSTSHLGISPTRPVWHGWHSGCSPSSPVL